MQLLSVYISFAVYVDGILEYRQRNKIFRVFFNRKDN